VPYFVSWLVSRSVVAGSGRGVTIFIGIAVVATIAACGFYLDVISPLQPIPPIVVSVGITAVLVAAARLCATLASD
jgi:hypothetical protein